VEHYSYDSERSVLNVGVGSFGPIAHAVWDYNVSGFPVLDSWLGYRMTVRSGRKSSDLDQISSEKWTARATTDLLQLIWILEETLSIAPAQSTLLDEILASGLVDSTVFDFSKVPDAFRKPEAYTSGQTSLGFEKKETE
jgi:hypothetical protein